MIIGRQIEKAILEKALKSDGSEFLKDEYYLSSVEAEKIKKRKASFKHFTKTHKQIFITLISLGNLINSKESIGLIDNSFSADILI